MKKQSFKEKVIQKALKRWKKRIGFLSVMVSGYILIFTHLKL